MFSILPMAATAWVYPEHRDITLAAIQKLDSGHRARLDALWSLARKGYESRLDTSVADVAQGEHPDFIDYAAFPAIAGDHSVSAENLLNTVLHTDWILHVADVAAGLKNGLAAAHNSSERAAEMRRSDLRFLRVDPGYVTRAGSNNVHFMLALPDVEMNAAEYFDLCLKKGSEINQIGVYEWFHASALLKASRLASPGLTMEQRSALALASLADEAFALHFLEDGFSAGHVAGIRGNAALRKGTHDFYDEMGLKVNTWQGEPLVLTGDAYMRKTDADRAAATIAKSLEQLLDAAVTGYPSLLYDDRQGMNRPDTLNIARTDTMPERWIDPVLRPLLDQVLLTTPVPGLTTGLGEIPRFRAEIGPFIGIAPAARFSVLSGGFGTSQQTAGVVPGLEFAIHVGLGLDGVLDQSGDGLVFLDIGYRLDGSSTIKVEHDPSYKPYGSILSAVPTRAGLFARIRMPYYVIPGDLLILGPLLLIVSPETMNNVVARAGQGGLIPWQSGLITPIGRFQFILGREVGVCFYGWLQHPDAYILPDPDTDPVEYKFVSMRSTQLDFPFLEYRPFKTFSKRQCASLLLQFYTGVDIPGKMTVMQPEGSAPVAVKTIWMGGVRLAFDWRFYYAKKRSSTGH
jgi:hypothetical protein